MEENTSLVLSKTQLIALDKEYSSLNEKAHFDDSWETDYKAALIAPAAFLINEKATNFETTFDRILFHLDEAFKKADEASIKRSISRNADDLFSGIVFVLQTLLYELKKKK